MHDSRGIEIAKFHNFARTISRHADGISAGPLLPLYLVVLGPRTDEQAGEEDVDAGDMRLAAVPVLQRARWPSADTLHLDESQLRAVQTALTRRLAIIQGPPGTGKTHIGLKVVQVRPVA